jgi:hypothetical protein
MTESGNQKTSLEQDNEGSDPKDTPSEAVQQEASSDPQAKEAGPSFQEAIEEVEETVREYAAKATTEAQSQAEKNEALYKALDRAFSFHKAWHGRQQYAGYIAKKGVKPEKRGKESSPFIPTIKAFFDPELDKFNSDGDPEKKREKARRQKAVSTYCAVLDFAQTGKPNDQSVSDFIATHGGIEAARAAWSARRKNSPEAVQKKNEAHKRRLESAAAAFEILKEVMGPSLHTEKFKGEARLVAAYFDESGKPHFIGVVDDSAADKYLFKLLIKMAEAHVKKKVAAVAAKSDLHRLIKVVEAGKIAHESANVLLVNDGNKFEMQSSHGSADTCIVTATLPANDFLPVGKYWFGMDAINAMRTLFGLEVCGAKISIVGPSVVNGITASVELKIANCAQAIDRYNQTHEDQWDWGAISSGGEVLEPRFEDGDAFVVLPSTTEKLACLKLINSWDEAVILQGDLEKWVIERYGVSRRSADKRLVKAIYSGPNKTTAFRIENGQWVIIDEDGDVEAHTFKRPLGTPNFNAKFTVRRGELLSAIQYVKNATGGASATLSMKDKLIKIWAKYKDASAEVIIPCIEGDSRFKDLTEFSAQIF